MDDTVDGADDSIDAPMDEADGAGEDLGALDVDPDDLDDDSVALDVDLEGEDLDAEPATADDVEIPVAPDRLGIDDEEEEEEERPRRRVSEEDVDDNEMLSKEDVEADLASILQEKLASSDEFAPEDEVAEQEDFTDGTPMLQPRRPDEEHCQQCFLLVRRSAPKCPVDHDLCPLFPSN